MPFCLLQAPVMSDPKLRCIFINIEVLCCHTLYLAKKKLVYSSCFKALFVTVGYSELLVSRTASIQSIQKNASVKIAHRRQLPFLNFS